MRDVDELAAFYGRLPVVSSFRELTDPAAYAPLPEGWVLGVADIVRSTRAIEAGRYKAVNTASAAVIAAVANGLGPDRAFPFIFGGDGAGFALPAADAPFARQALAETAAWVRDDLGLELRVALVPVADTRAAGRDVRVARFAASAGVTYAMFDGGGLAFAEQRMKAGEYAVTPAGPGTMPNLAGLSCRFSEIRAVHGVILSLIVEPAGPDTDPEAVREVLDSVVRMAQGTAEAGRPMSSGSPAIRWPSRQSIDLEAKANRHGRKTARLARLRTVALNLLAYALFRTGIPAGGFDPNRYRRELVENTDFRKFDDGLRMTLDCTPALADAIEELLADADARGVTRHGTYRQEAALMTCFVPAPTRNDHVHFIDGATGGYAAAAAVLKARALPAPPPSTPAS